MTTSLLQGIALSAAFVLGGCTTVLVQTDRSRVEGRLVDSDAARRAVQLRFDDGTEAWIPLETVTEAERPGTLTMLLGAGWLVGGALLLSIADDESTGLLEMDGLFRGAGYVSLIGAVGLLASGLSNWQDANDHLERAGWTD